MMPGEASSNESGFFLEFINKILGNNVISEHIIRKTAHFMEYMLLALLCCGNYAVFNKKGLEALIPVLYICLLTAAVDESIQLFTVGRSGMLFDIWLDHIGSITGAVTFNVIKHIVKH